VLPIVGKGPSTLDDEDFEHLTADDMPTFATLARAWDDRGFALVRIRHDTEACSAVAYKCSYGGHREDNLRRPLDNASFDREL
jgi:hypothetical protein